MGRRRRYYVIAIAPYLKPARIAIEGVDAVLNPILGSDVDMIAAGRLDHQRSLLNLLPLLLLEKYGRCLLIVETEANQPMRNLTADNPYIHRACRCKPGDFLLIGGEATLK